MPIVHSLNKTMEQRITEYYGGASVYRPNKFLVGLYGEYVGKAMKTMMADSKEERSPSARYNGNKKRMFNTDVYDNALDAWYRKYYFPEDDQVELKWACADVTIPTVKSSYETKSVRLDNHKSIKYPLLRSADSDGGEIKLTIVEDRNLMMYQFFNALHNQFYIPQILKPKSSFHKLGMYVAALQEDFVKATAKKENGELRDHDLESVVSQVFEFNSIAITGISDLQFKNDSKEIMTFTVSFKAPNLFQGVFKTSFKGLRNTGSDALYLASNVDAVMLDPRTSEYKVNQFEITKKEMDAPGNGVYPDQWD